MIILAIAIAFGLSYVLLYARKSRWATDSFRWKLTGTVAFAGAVGFIAVGSAVDHDSGALFGCMQVPLIYNLCDRWFKRISEKKQGRDFYLYLRGSNEIDDRIGGKNPHVSALDKMFSGGLWLVIVATTLIAGMLFKPAPLWR